MKSRFLTLLLMLTFTLITVVMGWGYGISTVTHDWTTPENEQSANDPLFGSAYKYAAKGHSVSPSTNTSTYWASSYSSVSLEVTAELLSIGDEMNVTGWTEATSDQGLVSPPSRDGVRTDKIVHGSDGTHYFYDAKHATDMTGNASAMTAYKAQ